MSAHYDKIVSRWKNIARLYHEASAALMATDRAAGVNSLKAELEMMENDIEAYRNVAQSIRVEDIVEMHIVAGRQRWRAEQIVREDFEDLESILKQVENKLKELKADIVYGFEEEEYLADLLLWNLLYWP
jgi:DNA polymerase elongation subunit (family B)